MELIKEMREMWNELENEINDKLKVTTSKLLHLATQFLVSLLSPVVFPLFFFYSSGLI